MRPTFIIAAGFVVLPVLSSSASAQANRTFVSGHGSDSNLCTLAAPCRSFAEALTQTNAGGEITILDPAGYGAVNINKAVSIVNDGVGEAGVTTASATDGIDINIGASDVVNLRGLTLVGGGVGVEGILFNNRGTLNIQNCVIRGFTDAGMDLAPAGAATFNITDTIVSNVAGNAVEVVPNGTGTVTAVFNRVQAIGGVNDGFLIDGVNATGAVNATIANSVASNNGQTGIFTESAAAGANTQVTVVNSVVANNAIGIVTSGANSTSGASATTYLAKNTIAGNMLAVDVLSSGALFSFGDNDVKSNGDDGGAISLVATK